MILFFAAACKKKEKEIIVQDEAIPPQYTFYCGVGFDMIKNVNNGYDTLAGFGFQLTKYLPVKQVTQICEEVSCTCNGLSDIPVNSGNNLSLKLLINLLLRK